MAAAEKHWHMKAQSISAKYLVPRSSTPPIIDCMQYAKEEGEALGDFIT